MLFLPTLLLGLLMAVDGFNGFPSFLRSGPYSESAARIWNNIVLVGILLGVLFICCSRERVEDELIGRIRLNALLAPGGQALLDSSDLSYVFEDEDGVFIPPPGAPYYGEVEFRMVYRHVRGPRFPWLYIDFDTLARHASQNGFTATRLLNGAHYDYLARLTPTDAPASGASSDIA